MCSCRFYSAPVGGAVTVPTDLESLRRRIAEIVDADVSEITDDDLLMDLGLDSVRAMVLLAEWRAAGLAVDTSLFLERPTLADWSAILSSASQSAG